MSFWIRAQLLHVIDYEGSDSMQKLNINHANDACMLCGVEARPVNTESFPTELYHAVEAATNLFCIASVDERVMVTRKPLKNWGLETS